MTPTPADPDQPTPDPAAPPQRRGVVRPNLGGIDPLAPEVPMLIVANLDDLAERIAQRVVELQATPADPPADPS